LNVDFQQASGPGIQIDYLAAAGVQPQNVSDESAETLHQMSESYHPIADGEGPRALGLPERLRVAASRPGQAKPSHRRIECRWNVPPGLIAKRCSPVASRLNCRAAPDGALATVQNRFKRRLGPILELPLLPAGYGQRNGGTGR
jgi:hypothetical protein